MPNDVQWKASILLAVFLVGGLTAPLVHRFEHVRELQHRHGQASQDFSPARLASVGHLYGDLLVEERTTPHELNCDLCARLGYDALVGTSDAPPPANRSFYADRCIALHLGLSEGHLSIRAPPIAV